MFWVGLKVLAATILIGVGTALLVLPGPGIPLIVAGILVLATEFSWAASLQERVNSLWQQVVRGTAGA